jgi:3-methyladenine DNA glycosylase AlkD
MCAMPAKQKAATLTDLESVIKELERAATAHTRDGMSRFGISTADKVLGVSMTDMKAIAKRTGKNHTLSGALWSSEIYDARMLACLIDEPDKVTPSQMDRWAKDFDNWATCDTACFHLFDKTPHAYAKVAQWAKRSDEFVKRAAFALLASLALHDKKGSDDLFADGLAIIEAFDDDRNFVKKSVSWALRGIGKRNAASKMRAINVARKLAASEESGRRWAGKDALRELQRIPVKKPAKRSAD